MHYKNNLPVIFTLALCLLLSCSNNKENENSSAKTENKKIRTYELIFEYDMFNAIENLALDSHKDKDYTKIIGLAKELSKSDTTANAVDLLLAAYSKLKPKGKNLNYFFGTGKPETDTVFNDINTMVFIKNHIRREFNSNTEIILEMLKKYHITNLIKNWIPPKYMSIVFDCAEAPETISQFSLSSKGSLLAFDPVVNDTWVVELFHKLDKLIPEITKKDPKYRDAFENHKNKIAGKIKDNPESGGDYIDKFPFTHMMMVFINNESGSPVGVSLEQYSFPKTGNTSYYTIFTDTSNLDFYYETMNHPEINRLFNDKYRFVNTTGRFAAENKGAAEIFAVAKQPALTDKNVIEALATLNDYKIPIVLLNFDSTGAKIFEDITGRNIKKRIAISVGGEVYSAPVVQSKITGGTASITGLKDLEEADRLESMLNSGTLKWPVKIISIKTKFPN